MFLGVFLGLVLEITAEVQTQDPLPDAELVQPLFQDWVPGGQEGALGVQNLQIQLPPGNQPLLDSAQQPYQPPPEGQSLPGDAQMIYRPSPNMLYQQRPHVQMMYQPIPDTQLRTRPDDGSEECEANLAANPLHSGKFPLEEGRVYCAQAADSRWWDVTVTARNCDGSYAVQVKDAVGTEWPVAQRAYFLDKPCNDFYRDALVEQGLSEEDITSALQNQGFQEYGAQEYGVQQSPPPPYQGGDPVEFPVKPGHWPSAKTIKKMPLGMVAAAAAAGAVPLIYGLSGS